MKALGVGSLMAAAVTAFASGKLVADEAPVKVHILAGQSNMVGIGQVSGSSRRWGDEFSDPLLSVCEGAYDSSKNYDDLTPIEFHYHGNAETSMLVGEAMGRAMVDLMR